jgi:ketosteroid isomerase-like protein
MSSANVETVRRVYADWIARGRAVFDDGAELAVVGSDFELHPDPDAWWVGMDDTYLGPDGVRRYMSAVYEAFVDYRPEVEDVLDAGDRVVTLAIEHGRGRDSGAQVEESRTAHVWTFEDGRAVRLDLYLDRDRALRDVGLAQ